MTSAQSLPPLANNIKKWRVRRGMSLSGLARAASISKSTVSELERGNGNPSLDTLWTLAKTLSIPLGFLFLDEQGAEELNVRRRNDAPILARDGEDFIARLLSSWQGHGEVELSIVSLGDSAERNSRGNAAGVIERAVCMSGTVEVGPVGRSTVLTPGDMVSFAADQPHVYRAIGGPGELIVVQQYTSMA